MLFLSDEFSCGFMWQNRVIVPTVRAPITAPDRKKAWLGWLGDVLLIAKTGGDWLG